MIVVEGRCNNAEGEFSVGTNSVLFLIIDEFFSRFLCWGIDIFINHGSPLKRSLPLIGFNTVRLERSIESKQIILVVFFIGIANIG